MRVRQQLYNNIHNPTFAGTLARLLSARMFFTDVRFSSMASTCSSTDCAGCSCATKKGVRRDFTRNEAVFDLWKNFAEELKEDLVGLCH